MNSIIRPGIAAVQYLGSPVLASSPASVTPTSAFPSFVGIGTHISGIISSAAPTIHASTQPGDIVFAVAAVANASPGTVSASGWTPVRVQSSGSATIRRLTVLYRVHQAGDTMTPTISLGVSARSHVTVITYRGPGASPVHATNGSSYNGTDTTQQGATVTTTVNTKVLFFGMAQGSGGNAISVTPPTGFTERLDLYDAVDMWVSLADRDFNAGTLGAFTGTLSMNVTDKPTITLALA